LPGPQDQVGVGAAFGGGDLADRVGVDGAFIEGELEDPQGQGAALAQGGRADLGRQVVLPAADVGRADALDRAVTEPGPHVQPEPAFGDGQGVGAAVGVGGVQLPPLIGPAAERQPAAAAARLRTLMDGLLIAASLLFLGWATVLGDAFRSNGESSILERMVIVAYPLGDIVAGTIVLMLLTRSRGRGVIYLSMIAAAVFSLLFADLGFAYKTPTGSYGIGAMVDAGWVVGWLLLATSALKPTVAELRRSDDEEEPSITRLALPYAPLVVAAVTALVIQIVTGGFEPFLVYVGTMIGLLVISRQIVALIENRQLNARLRATVIELSEREWELREELRRAAMNAAENARRQPAAR
jgi:hypothetical protein